MLIAFVPIVSAQAEKLSDNSDVKQITMELNQKDGVIIIPIDNEKIVDLSPSATSEKAASALFSGMIDDNNFVTLEGVITLDGKDKKIALSGEATQVFVGWEVPNDAKAINITVGNEEIGYKNITRYEGATKKYATYVDLKDKNEKTILHGEFFEDGHGGLVGTTIISGKECVLALLGESTSIFENVSSSVSTKSSYISVPHRSQWELLWDGHGYAAASTACGDTVCAMLEEYYTGTSPDIWDIYDEYGAMTASDAEEYLQDQGINVYRRPKTGTLSYILSYVQACIDADVPFYLAEESAWGNPHAVVLKGYNDAYDYFTLNDPNTISGVEQMYWYEADNSGFSFEENVYEYVGGSDPYSNGMVIVA